VSALPEVIANLRAAIADTKTARSEIRRVIDLVEQLVSQLRADTDGSTSDLVEDDFSQLTMATEKRRKLSLFPPPATKRWSGTSTAYCSAQGRAVEAKHLRS